MTRHVRGAAPALTALALGASALGGLVAGASALAAQTPATTTAAAGAACEIEQNSPAQIPMAALALAKAQAAQKADDKAKNLREAVKLLSEKPDAASKNPVGHAYVLGQVLAIWANTPELPVVTTRGNLGYTTNKDQQVDVLAAIDTALTVVERQRPACAEQVAGFRQPQAWLNLVNGAIAAINAKQLDSARALAQRSLLVNRTSPYGYYILANVAQQQNPSQAEEYWAKVVEFAGSDTSARAMKMQALYNVAAGKSAAVDAATGAAQKTAAQAAIPAMKAFLAEAGTDPDATPIRSSLARMYMLVGDTASVPSVYADLIANPSRYSDLALSEAGVAAARLERVADAARLFEGALAQNPYQRDALNNLASVYYTAKEYRKVFPVADRLVKLDPSNPDNWFFYAFAYQELMKNEKAPAAKKAYTDSLLKYKSIAEKQPVKVTFTQFTRGAERTSLGVSVENVGAAAKPVTLTFEFLDKNGAVIGTQQAALGTIEKGGKKTATVTFDKGGVYGFRYAPVS
jgi:tetratricopeptide (TPR) repeat protein